MEKRQITFSPPDITEAEIEAVADTLRSGWITTGPKCKEFEKKIAQFIGMSIIELDGSYQMCTKPRMYEYLIKIAKQPKKRVLSDVLLETLSISSESSYSF